MENQPKIDCTDIEAFLAQSTKAESTPLMHLNATPENVENGLVKLVLGLIEVIRQLVEKQALRRVEGGKLTEDEIERLGQTLLKLEEKMEELKAHFHLTDDDLKLDLGFIQNLD